MYQYQNGPCFMEAKGFKEKHLYSLIYGEEEEFLERMDTTNNKSESRGF